MILPKRVTSTLKEIPLLYGIIWIIVFSVHCVYLSKADGIVVFPDSAGYYGLSRISLIDEEFYRTWRPPGILLFYKLFGSYSDLDWKSDSYSPDSVYDPDRVWKHCIHRTRSKIICPDDLLLYSQSLFSLAACTLLGLAGAMTGRTSKGRLTLFVFPLLFSVTPLVAEWNFIALSESFSLSFFFVFVALWTFFLKFKHPFWLVGIGMTALLWASIRDLNNYVLVMIAVVIAIMTIIMLVRGPLTRLGRGRLPRSLLFSLAALCIFFVIIFKLDGASADQGHRYVYCFYDLIANRILPVPEYVAYFSDHGMPVSPALYERMGTIASSDNGAFYKDPRLEEFRAWTYRSGKTTYINFLISHPLYLITAPVLTFPDVFLKDDLSGFVSGHYSDYVFSTISIPLTDRHAAAISWLLFVGYGITISLVFLLWWYKLLDGSPWLMVSLIMILLSIPHLWLAAHGNALPNGAMERRHGVPAIVQACLGFPLLYIYLLDRLGAHVSRWKRLMPAA